MKRSASWREGNLDELEWRPRWATRSLVGRLAAIVRGPDDAAADIAADAAASAATSASETV